MRPRSEQVRRRLPVGQSALASLTASALWRAARKLPPLLATVFFFNIKVNVNRVVGLAASA
ncbi:MULTISPECIES: hypothetical protein [unclassified Serratia (in: enterobacteria)]|uniref:hypothetical protein n=1 Tax=unclassified Serratia (in: enterobacteria) TaxID=2647522 RepID=UPI003075F7FA